MVEPTSPSAKRSRVAEDADSNVAVYTGEEGSLAHIAATQFFKSFPLTKLKGVHSFDCAFRDVASGKALYGIVPIENSASGTLHSTYDLLVEHDVVIGGELGVREVYCLCKKSGEKGLAGVRRVVSHPNIIAACSSFIETRLTPAVRADADIAGPLATLATRSTTEAARRVADRGSDAEGSTDAAIATREAAARFNLKILAEDIGNDAFLETRYILIHRRVGTAATQPTPFPRDAVSPVRKRSACFALRNEPGAIFKLLSCWALRGINVLKVETRPLAGGHRAPPGLPAGTARLWDYLFYVDYAVPPGHSTEESTRLWDALSEFSLWQRDFGAYPSQTTRAEKQAQSWEEMVDIMAKA
mmetsp:Transcript_11365/g.28648  ORF Transcript_11365/g.28648 Transcript_11365/m.28648 type:complete len:358 (-) Transcript_11365:76-1149(-)